MARSTGKRIFGSLLFWVAVAAVLAFVFLLYADSINDDNVPFVDKTGAVALVVTIALGVIALALFLMLVTRRWSEKAEEAEDAEVFFLPEPVAAAPAPTTEFEAAPEITLYDLRKVPVGARSWSAPEADGRQHPFYFPRSVTGGIYVNDYIPVDSSGRLLKLRTLLGGPFDVAFSDLASPTSGNLRRVAPTREEPPQRAPATIRQAEAPSVMVLQEVQAATVEPTPEAGVFVDYPGDNHEVEDLEGIGPTYGKKLRDAGVHTTARLAYEDAAALAARLQVPKGTVEAWQHMAELVKVKGIGPQYAEALVRAGITGIADLKRRSPAKMADQINAYLDTLDVNVLGNKITEKRVEGWKEAAKTMKRVRLQIPER